MLKVVGTGGDAFLSLVQKPHLCLSFTDELEFSMLKDQNVDTVIWGQFLVSVPYLLRLLSNKLRT